MFVFPSQLHRERGAVRNLCTEALRGSKVLFAIQTGRSVRQVGNYICVCAAGARALGSLWKKYLDTHHMVFWQMWVVSVWMLDPGCCKEEYRVHALALSTHPSRLPFICELRVWGSIVSKPPSHQKNPSPVHSLETMCHCKQFSFQKRFQA